MNRVPLLFGLTSLCAAPRLRGAPQWGVQASVHLEAAAFASFTPGYSQPGCRCPRRRAASPLPPPLLLLGARRWPLPCAQSQPASAPLAAEGSITMPSGRSMQTPCTSSGCRLRPLFSSRGRSPCKMSLVLAFLLEQAFEKGALGAGSSCQVH